MFAPLVDPKMQFTENINNNNNNNNKQTFRNSKLTENVAQKCIQFILKYII